MAPHSVGPGDIIVLGRSAKATLRASRLGDWRLCYFRLYPELLSGFLTFSEQNYLACSASASNSIVRYYSTENPIAGEFAMLCCDGRSTSHLAMRCKMLELAASVISPELQHWSLEKKRRSQTVERFLQLVEDLPGAAIEHRSLKELARFCDCTERHFTRLFHLHFGFSLRAKQVEMRLAKARRLLADSDLKIKNIAIESGFKHFGLFDLLFKKRFHMTPSQWRALSAEKHSPVFTS